MKRSSIPQMARTGPDQSQEAGTPIRFPHVRGRGPSSWNSQDLNGQALLWNVRHPAVAECCPDFSFSKRALWDFPILCTSMLRIRNVTDPRAALECPQRRHLVAGLPVSVCTHNPVSSALLLPSLHTQGAELRRVEGKWSTIPSAGHQQS